MANRIPNSPIELVTIPNGWRSIPEVPSVVQDAFGPKGIAVLHGDRWRGLVSRGSEKAFAWLDGHEPRASALTTRVTLTQTFESDERGRALVIGGSGNSLYAVEPSGAATCLGVLPDVRIERACWLPRGGVAVLLGRDICIYTPGRDGRLLPRLRFAALHPEFSALRCLPSSDDEVMVLAAIYDDRGAVYAIDSDARVHILADFEGLSMADVQLFLDETGNRTMLLSGAAITLDGNPTTVEGLEQAIAEREQFPLAELSFEAAPDLEAGPDFPALTEDEAKVESPQPAMAPDALTQPSLDRLGRLTKALIRMLRAAPKRSAPDMEVLKLIRSGMAHDLRAYVHAWAVHAPNNPAVYEFWMATPKLENRESIREHAGESVQLGTFASGEPIVARMHGAGSCEVVMIDEEGIPYRYSGLEGFLLDLQMRAPGEFELDDWMD